MNKEYVYHQNTSDLIWKMMSPAEQQTFPFNVKLIDWNYCL
jgi:hypothetical protein